MNENVRNILRFLCVSCPTWIVYAVLSVVLMAIGLPLVAWQSARTRPRPSESYPNRWCLQFEARWMWLWGNDEDGIDGLRAGSGEQQWWAYKTFGDTNRERIFKWSALRNSVGNQGRVPVLSPLAPKVVGHWGRIYGKWIIAYYWTGPYTGIRILCGTRQLTIGWKLWDFYQPGTRVPFAMRYLNSAHTAVNIEAT